MYVRQAVWVFVAATCWLLSRYRVSGDELAEEVLSEHPELRRWDPDADLEEPSEAKRLQQLQARKRARLRREHRDAVARNRTMARLHIEPGRPVPGEPRPKRVLVYCMQNAGCTLFALLLAQLPGSLVIPDLFISNYVRAPYPGTFVHVRGVSLIVVKIVINGADPLPRLEEHKHRFQPDVTVLYVRDPWVNVGKLKRKSYGSECGSVQSKLTALEEIYRERERLADVTVYYHELCLATDRLIERLQAVGVGNGMDFVRPPWRRGMRDILQDAHVRTAKERTFGFGGGNVHRGAGQYNSTWCSAALVQDLTAHAPHELCDLHIPQLAPALAADHLELRNKLGVPLGPACEPPPDFWRFELFPSLPHCTSQLKTARNYDWPVPPDRERPPVNWQE